MRLEGGGGAQNKIVISRRQIGGKRAVDAETRVEIGGITDGTDRKKLDLIAEVGERHQALQRVIAVGVRCGDVKKEVDLGGCEHGDWSKGWAVSKKPKQGNLHQHSTSLPLAPL